jgi:hypothetical protein
MCLYVRGHLPHRLSWVAATFSSGCTRQLYFDCDRSRDGSALVITAKHVSHYVLAAISGTVCVAGRSR